MSDPLSEAAQALSDNDLPAWTAAFDDTCRRLAADGQPAAANLHRVVLQALVKEKHRRRREIRDLNTSLGRTTTWWD